MKEGRREGERERVKAGPQGCEAGGTRLASHRYQNQGGRGQGMVSLGEVRRSELGLVNWKWHAAKMSLVWLKWLKSVWNSASPPFSLTFSCSVPLQSALLCLSVHSVPSGGLWTLFFGCCSPSHFNPRGSLCCSYLCVFTTLAELA